MKIDNTPPRWPWRPDMQRKCICCERPFAPGENVPNRYVNACPECYCTEKKLGFDDSSGDTMAFVGDNSGGCDLAYFTEAEAAVLFRKWFREYRKRHFDMVDNLERIEAIETRRKEMQLVPLPERRMMPWDRDGKAVRCAACKHCPDNHGKTCAKTGKRVRALRQWRRCDSYQGEAGSVRLAFENRRKRPKPSGSGPKCA